MYTLFRNRMYIVFLLLPLSTVEKKQCEEYLLIYLFSLHTSYFYQVASNNILYITCFFITFFLFLLCCFFPIFQESFSGTAHLSFWISPWRWSFILSYFIEANNSSHVQFKLKKLSCNFDKEAQRMWCYPLKFSFWLLECSQLCHCLDQRAHIEPMRETVLKSEIVSFSVL